MNLFVLTGAGISAESGLETFRDRGKTDGWSRADPTKLATPEAFQSDPDLVHGFYNRRRRDLLAASPNEAHYALARLERGLAARGGRLTLATQNVDDLHERAGSNGVIHIHGELLKARCLACDTVREWRCDLGRQAVCPGCGAGGTLRPHVVWFGEVPFLMDEIYRRLDEADRFVAIGTSGVVYPAAGLVSAARGIGIPTVEINLAPSENAIVFSQRRYGPASTAVPAFVDELLA